MYEVLSIPGAWNSGWDIPIDSFHEHTGAPREEVNPANATTDIAPEPDDNVEDADKPPIVIAVFGKTGTGKTTFIKAVTGVDLEIGHGLASCTEDVLAVPCRIDGKRVLLVDTPGFSDTNFSDTEILERIATWMQSQYNDKCLLSGIVYLHRISDIRMDGPSRKNLRMMRALCGASSLKNVVLTTTMWESVAEQVGLDRESELKGAYWRDMILGGATVQRLLTGSRGDACAIVRSLLNNKPTRTRLQEELDSGSTLVQTEAGRELREEFAKELQKLRLRQVKEMMEWRQAQDAHNSQLQQDLARERQESNRELVRLELEIKKLENAKPKKLPRAKVEGFFRRRYICGGCGRWTRRGGIWQCRKCNFQQENMAYW